MKLQEYIASQFMKPRGLFGKFTVRFMIKGNMGAIRWALECCEIQQADTILELGFGHGYGIAIASGKTDGKVYGLDFSDDMVKRARQLLKEAVASGKVVLFHGTAAHSPFTSDFFDKIFAVNVIYFWKQPDTELKEVLRILRPGGRAVFYLTDRTSIQRMKFTQTSIFTNYTGEEFSALVKAAGFSRVEVKTRESSRITGKFGHCVIGYK
jgi:SAM-dependent methyltransferase